jgi:glycosyltransferase involved in cell wall biosynthesis
MAQQPNEHTHETDPRPPSTAVGESSAGGGPAFTEPSGVPHAGAPAEATDPVGSVDRPFGVSVVMTVCNDVSGVAQVLQSLAEQTQLPDEIVIVDGGSEPRAFDRLREVVRSHEHAVLLKGKRCNIAQGRNRAIRMASHDVIACIDAGCVARPDWLERLTAGFLDPKVDVVGGGYEIAARGRFEELVGLTTMPGQLKPIQPQRFNPSARSLAFRRRVWERAKGFPSWLYAAEDTLFDLQLRSMQPQPQFVHAPDAIVAWRPRSGPRRVFKQFMNYCRGEARIGRGGDTWWHLTEQFALTFIWLALAVVLTQRLGGAWGAVVAALATFFVPHLGLASQVHHRTRRWLDIPAVIGLTAWISVARWTGFCLGRFDRWFNAETYVQRLREYFGSDTTSVYIPPWKSANPAPPRTLVVAWHWLPATRASAQVMANLLADGEGAALRVLTRDIRTSGSEGATHVPPLPTSRVPWPLDDDRPSARTWWAGLRTGWRMIRAARRVHLDWSVERILAVYPHGYGLLAGALLARLFGVPLFAYMHDLCYETLISQNRWRRMFWRLADEWVLSRAWCVIVPTAELAEHYRRRGLLRTWVLPHCVPADVESTPSPEPSDKLRLVYAGAVYEAHADAVAALHGAIETHEDVEVTWLTRTTSLVPGLKGQWVARRQAMARIVEADAAIVALGWDTPYPEEIAGCFPSKIVDYLAVGRPILAIVPRGCFVDRLIRESGCGVVVNSRREADIHAALDQLRDPVVRDECAARARALAQQLQPDQWRKSLIWQVLAGPTIPASAPFPGPIVIEEADFPQPVGAME